MPFESIFETAFGLPLISFVLAVIVVAPGYQSPYMNGLAIPAPMSPTFPFRSVARSLLLVFLVIVNLIGLGLLHRFPVGSTLIAGGLLILLLLPADGPGSDTEADH